MFAGTFALLQRAIRGDAQKARPHWLRIASVVLILVLLAVAHFRPEAQAAPGLGFFADISRLAMILIILAGLGHFATAITEEKEEGTLGLLLLADLSPFSILLGKSTSRVLSAWLLFVAQFPFALLALTLGGITVRQIAATYIALAMFLFLVANLALLASVCARRTAEAMALLVAMLFLVLGSIPWLQYMLSLLSGVNAPLSPQWAVWGNELFEIYKEFSIYHRVEEILTIRYHGGLWGTQATCALLVGAFAFFLAWAIFRRLIWDADVTAPARLQSAGQGTARWWNSVPRTWRAALVWKDFHFLFGGYSYWTIKLVAIPVFTTLIFYKADWVAAVMLQQPLACLESALYFLCGCELVYACSQLYHTEQKDGTLANLLMLPRSTAVISYSKLLGCLLGIAPTLLCALAISVVLHDWSDVRQCLLGPEYVAPMGTFLIFCHLTVLCSLITKWGGTALAAALMVLIATIAYPVVGSMMFIIHDAEHNVVAQIAPLYYVIFAVCGALQVAILMRLEAVAGE